MERARKLYLRTFGCQMNDADSSKIKRLLADMNIRHTDEPREADILLLNTCSIRWKAEHKVYSELGRFKKIKKNRPDIIIGVGGCVAQQEKDEMFRKAPHLDIVFGTHNIHRLPDMIKEVEEKRGHRSETDFFDSPEPLVYPAPEEGGLKAFVNIMRGCNNFCSYCIVPYVRGRETSRPYSEILEEISVLVQQGVKEFTLLGQNVNSYGNGSSDTVSFPDLIRKVAAIDGLERVRFATSHPKDLSDDLIDAFGETDKLCNHLHLPVQSGSNDVLKAMKRVYTVDSYIEKVERLKSVVPDISITTDMIVGFPGETDADFKKTLELMEKIKYDSAFSFKYSRRPGTAAADFEDTVAEEEKDERLAMLQTLQERHTSERNEAEEGKVALVLVEGTSKKREGMMMGRSAGNKVVIFKGDESLAFKTVPVRIVEGNLKSLYGELIELH
ncbi:MAG: tRNA (N6-isopentenyl adenosine(37)-C2)-methylthiotransferase MiaB [bacterium]|nr:tRNA (N6-isopentenyl adenosine(37)-C2)-methylthiotransferase MiaB [bacterium]